MPGHREDSGAAPQPAPQAPQAPAPDSPAMDESQRRLSTSSDASSSGLNDSAHKVDTAMDYIPTRMTKVSTPKPAANPLQFVKVGPCDLFKSAQETLKKVEEVKKMKKEVRDEAEDWQSNLDNWKCSRRKRVEHIIDRVVEVKKFELEEHERNRKKAKTFNEMMEERTSRGRKMSLLVHKDDDSNDLSDLGIGTSSDKSSVSEDYANDDNHSVDDGDVAVKNHFLDQSDKKSNGKEGKTTSDGIDDDASTSATVSSPEPEEYTYDRAIQGYMNFTETRVKARNVSSTSRTETECSLESTEETLSAVFPKRHSPASAPTPRKDSRVEEDIAEIERIQSRNHHNGSLSDLPNSERKLDLPKVNIHKRKELFERSESNDFNDQLNVAPRAAGDLVNSKSIRDRVSNLQRHKSEENVEKAKPVRQLSSEVSVKDRLSLLERQQSSMIQAKSPSGPKLNGLILPGETLAAPPTIKDRLNSLEKLASQERSRVLEEIIPTPITERLIGIEAPKEGPQKLTPSKDPSFHDKVPNFRDTEMDTSSQDISQPQLNSAVDSSSRFSKPVEEEFYHKRTFHRSLDSLDVDSSSILSNEPYERVQSLEDLDNCGPSRHYPASASSNENLVLSSHSGDTDREDSGIHTADVSCSVSQADEPVDFSDLNVPCANVHVESSGDYSHERTRNMNYAPPTIVSQLAKMTLAGSTDKVSSHLEVGPNPYEVYVKDSQGIMEKDLSSMTSQEADADVSLFLDQALLEEDMKMEIPNLNKCSSGPENNHENLRSQFLPSMTKTDACPIIHSNDVGVVPLAFPLGAPSSAEPPKEKPPPPPVEISDDEDKSAQSEFNPSLSASDNNSKINLGRLDSTKRLKKDIRRKRSDFLGIEGSNDDSYLEHVAPPPDMTTFLQEERRLEQELYRQMQPSLYPESDHGSNQGESRDSGVELDLHSHSHSHHVLSDYTHEDQPCENHSRQNSESFGNTSSTSEEDEIIKKEREIIEILEKEEQWRYGTNTVLSPSDHHQVGEKLAAKLRELEQEKMRLEWERTEELRKIAAEQAARQEDQRRIRMKEEHLRQQEGIGRLPADVPFDCNPSNMTLEALREERGRLNREQAELEHQREVLAANQINSRQSWDSSSSSSAHRSLQDVSGSSLVGSHNQLHVPVNKTSPHNYRLSLPDLQQSDLAVNYMGVHHHRPPPPIPPSKPLSAVSHEKHNANGLVRQGQSVSSSDSLPLISESQHHRHNAVGLPAIPVAASSTLSTGSQQMTRQTLHALSATPRSKIIATDTWVQAKKKPESQRNNNRDHYQHWLIQEAEHRRITEQHQRNAASRKSLPPSLSQGQLNQSKPASQPAPPQTTQTWQYQYPHHQHTVHQHQLALHQHPHGHSLHQHTHVPVQTSAPSVPPPPRQEKPLPDAIIQTLTQRVQNRVSINENHRRVEHSPARESRSSSQIASNNINNNNMGNININHNHTNGSYAANSQEKMLSVSGKKKCSHCNEELGRGAAMIIESLRLFYHMDCFKCCVCHVQLGDGLMGTDVRVRNHKLHCHNCYSSDDGVKFSCV